MARVSSDKSLIDHEDKSVTLNNDRKMVCLEAAWELEALAFVLPGLVPNVVDCLGAHHSVRGIASRVKELANVLMAGLGDIAVEVADIESIVLVTNKWECQGSESVSVGRN